jgi:pimeloyl-[acyl-carrier protein] methyl ester esterase
MRKSRAKFSLQAKYCQMQMLNRLGLLCSMPFCALRCLPMYIDTQSQNGDQGAALMPLVLLHGWAMHGGIFAPLLPYLQQHFQLYLVDLPGAGHASTEIFEPDACVQQLLDLALRLPGAAWLGWSLGGLLATEVALRLPACVSTLVLVGSSPCFLARPDWPHGMPASTFAQFGANLQQDWRAVVQRFLALEALGSVHEKQELRWLQETVFARGEPAPAALQAGLSLLQQTDLRARLRQLQVPSLWLGGSRDRIVAPAALDAAALLCGGDVQILPRAGHAPFLTFPAEVASALIAFSAPPKQSQNS